MVLRMWIFAVALVIAIAGLSTAQTISILEESQPSVVIPFTKDHEFQFDQVPVSGQTILLHIKSRMESPEIGGSMMFLKLFLNGKEIKPSKGRIVSRLVNKPLDTPVQAGLSYNWYTERDGWNVLYAPDFHSAKSHSYYVDDPYLYVLDVTDLINPVAENRLKIVNTCTADFFASYAINGKMDLVVGLLQLESKPGKSQTMLISESKLVNITNRGTPAAGPSKYTAQVTPGGGIAVHIGNNTYKFNSSFSYPDAGFNRLLAGTVSTSNQKGFKISVKDKTVTASGPDYIITRKVTALPQRIQVEDTIKNLNNKEALGLCVKNELDISKLIDAPVRLAGNPDSSVSEYHSYGNPSVHLVTPEGGIGIIAEDDVFRHQVKLYASMEQETESTVAGLRTEMLCVQPGKSYTLVWSIYPISGPDYFDFVNLVRADWGANYTALGPWRWGILEKEAELPIDKFRELLISQGVKYYMAPDWAQWVPGSRIAMGTDVFSDYWKTERQNRMDIINKIHEAVPGIKTTWYMNSRRETAEDALTRFADSLMTDENGNYQETFWPNCGATNPSYTMVPTLKNNFGKAMVETAKRYLDEIELDGIYWDEVEGIMFNSILCTYSMLDGNSCLLDPNTWRIKREVGIVPLLEKDYYREIAKQVNSRGKVLLANGPTGFKTTLQDKVQRMVEMQHNDVYGYEANLQTPIGYMCWGATWQESRHAIEQGMVPGVFITTALPYDISAYLFPFTTIELHSGYLLAKERIVALHTGKYGWQQNQSLVRVRHFDSTGKITDKDFPTTAADRTHTDVTLGEMEAVVLERLPVVFAPEKNSTATAKNVIYSAEGVSANINAPKGGVFKVFNGEFTLNDAEIVNVNIGGITSKAKVTGDFIKITLPKNGFSGIVKVYK